jgi:hypothetical protein
MGLFRVGIAALALLIAVAAATVPATAGGTRGPAGFDQPYHPSIWQPRGLNSDSSRTDRAWGVSSRAARRLENISQKLMTSNWGRCGELRRCLNGLSLSPHQGRSV